MTKLNRRAAPSSVTSASSADVTAKSEIAKLVAEIVELYESCELTELAGHASPANAVVASGLRVDALFDTTRSACIELADVLHAHMSMLKAETIEDVASLLLVAASKYDIAHNNTDGDADFAIAERCVASAFEGLRRIGGVANHPLAAYAGSTRKSWREHHADARNEAEKLLAAAKAKPVSSSGRRKVA